MIDAHCHFWRLERGDYRWLDGEGGALAPLRRDFMPNDHPCPDTTLIVVQAAETAAETEFLLDLAARDPRIQGVVGWVDLTIPTAVATLRYLAADPLFKGVRPMLQDNPDTEWLLKAPRPEAMAALPSLGLRFDALVTTRHLPVLARFASANPFLPIVIDHAAKPAPDDHDTWRSGMVALARHPQVMCKLSGLLTELPPDALVDPLPILRRRFDTLLELFGPARLIWGSDWPVLTLAATYERWRELTSKLLVGLSPVERRAILGGNAARFYGVYHG